MDIDNLFLKRKDEIYPKRVISKDECIFCMSEDLKKFINLFDEMLMEIEELMIKIEDKDEKEGIKEDLHMFSEEYYNIINNYEYIPK